MIADAERYRLHCRREQTASPDSMKTATNISDYSSAGVFSKLHIGDESWYRSHAAWQFATSLISAAHFQSMRHA